MTKALSRGNHISVCRLLKRSISLLSTKRMVSLRNYRVPFELRMRHFGLSNCGLSLRRAGLTNYGPGHRLKRPLSATKSLPPQQLLLYVVVDSSRL